MQAGQRHPSSSSPLLPLGCGFAWEECFGSPSQAHCHSSLSLLVSSVETKGQLPRTGCPQHLGSWGGGQGWGRHSWKPMLREEGSLSGCEQEDGSWRGWWLQPPDAEPGRSMPAARQLGFRKQQGAESLGRDLLLRSCRHLSEPQLGFFLFCFCFSFLTTHFTVSRKERHYLHGSLNSKQTLVPWSSVPSYSAQLRLLSQGGAGMARKRASWVGNATRPSF